MDMASYSGGLHLTVTIADRQFPDKLASAHDPAPLRTGRRAPA